MMIFALGIAFRYDGDLIDSHHCEEWDDVSLHIQ